MRWKYFRELFLNLFFHIERLYKHSKLEKNVVGLAAKIDDIRSYLNKLTDKNYDEIFESIVTVIKEIIVENNIKGIVVGNPINMDGSIGPSGQSAKDFTKYLSNNVSIPVSMWDERLSSEGAFNLSSNLDVNVSKKVDKLDQNAASFILQGAIDYLRR